MSKKSKIVVILVITIVVIAILSAFIIPKLIHEWKPATCTQPETCVKCGKTRGSTVPHEMVVATCTEPAHCKNCSYTYGEPNGHRWSQSDCLHRKKCTVCGIEDGDLGPHNFEPATCNKPSTCSICGEQTGEKIGHDFVNGGDCSRCGFNKFFGYSKSTTQTAEPKSGLQLEDLRLSTSAASSYKVVSGTVKNYDTETHYFIKVKATFYDSDGNSVDIGDTYACGSEGLEHGESAKFEIYVDYDSKIKTANAKIYDYD